MEKLLKRKELPLKTEISIPIILLKEVDLLNAEKQVVRCTPGEITIQGNDAV